MMDIYDTKHNVSIHKLCVCVSVCEIILDLLLLLLLAICAYCQTMLCHHYHLLSHLGHFPLPPHEVIHRQQ